MAHTADIDIDIDIDIERDGTETGPLLLATKFHSPRWHADLVSRPRLVETLRRGSERKLTLISGPSGFGKTALLAEWLAGDAGRAASWLALDQQDNDPARFWTYASAAGPERRDRKQHDAGVLHDTGEKECGGHSFTSSFTCPQDACRTRRLRWARPLSGCVRSQGTASLRYDRGGCPSFVRMTARGR